MTVSSLNMFDYSLWLWWWFVSWLIGTSALRCFGQEAFSSLLLGCQKLDGYRRTRQQSRYVSESDLSSRRRQDVNSTCVWTWTWTCFLFGSSVLPRLFLTQVEGQRSGGECKLCIDMPFLSLLALPPSWSYMSSIENSRTSQKQSKNGHNSSQFHSWFHMISYMFIRFSGWKTSLPILMTWPSCSGLKLRSGSWILKILMMIRPLVAARSHFFCDNAM